MSYQELIEAQNKKMTKREICICNYAHSVMLFRAESLEAALKTRDVDKIIREVKESISVLKGEARVITDKKQINGILYIC